MLTKLQSYQYSPSIYQSTYPTIYLPTHPFIHPLSSSSILAIIIIIRLLFFYISNEVLLTARYTNQFKVILYRSHRWDARLTRSYIRIDGYIVSIGS